MRMTPSPETGNAPRTSASTALPSPSMSSTTRSMKSAVGAATARLPAFTVPLAPTTKPWGSANSSSPPTAPLRMALSSPFTTARLSCTRLISRRVPAGSFILVVLPRRTRKCLKSLKPFSPRTVSVDTVVVSPSRTTRVAVSPVMTMSLPAAAGALANAETTAARDRAQPPPTRAAAIREAATVGFAR